MPELRKDPVTGSWVVIAPERGHRPSDFHPRVPAPHGRYCPFCPGHEADTPREVFAIRDGKSWTVRVVPNLYPALKVEGEIDAQAHGIYDRTQGIGAHEVIIETPEHRAMFARFKEKQAADVFWAYRERMADLTRDQRLRYIQVFKNHGAAAGATLEHEHSQLVATPLVPWVVQHRTTGAKRWYKDKERCVYCDVIRQERREGDRLVYENDAFVAFCPYASRAPFQVVIFPKKHGSHFEHVQRETTRALADATLAVLHKIDVALESPAYNWMLHSGPLREPPQPYFHWHLEIAPALTRPGGFEWGTGTFINPTAPEEAAEVLRKTDGRRPE